MKYIKLFEEISSHELSKDMNFLMSNLDDYVYYDSSEWKELFRKVAYIALPDNSYLVHSFDIGYAEVKIEHIHHLNNSIVRLHIYADYNYKNGIMFKVEMFYDFKGNAVYNIQFFDMKIPEEYLTITDPKERQEKIETYLDGNDPDYELLNDGDGELIDTVYKDYKVKIFMDLIYIFEDMDKIITEKIEWQPINL